MKAEPRHIIPVLTLAALVVTHSAAAAPSAHSETARRVASYEMLGETSFPSSTTFAGTTVGGLSGISAGEQLDLLKEDFVVLQGRGELASQDADTLGAVLAKVADALEDGNERKAAGQLVDFRNETRRAREKGRMSLETEAYFNGGANLVRDLLEESAR